MANYKSGIRWINGIDDTQMGSKCPYLLQQSDMGFKSPDASAGIIMSRRLVSDMAQHFADSNKNIRGLPRDFSIDPEFELAQAIYYRHVDNSDGNDLSNILCICILKWLKYLQEAQSNWLTVICCAPKKVTTVPSGIGRTDHAWWIWSLQKACCLL